MACTALYMRPDEIATYPLIDGTLGAVSTSNVDETYDGGWIIDAWPGRPTRWTAAAVSGTITFPAAFSVNMAAVLHHNLPAGTVITFGGGITVVVTTGAATKNGIPLGAYNTFVTVVGATGATFSFTGGSTPVVGEIAIGASRSLGSPLLDGFKRMRVKLSKEMQTDVSSVPPYRRRLAADALTAQFYMTDSELDAVNDLYDAQLEGTRPTVLVPNDSTTEAVTGFFEPPSPTKVKTNLHRVQMTFVEIPRPRFV